MAPDDEPQSKAARQQVLRGLRAGMGFFSACKEGITRFSCDGSGFRRDDEGELPPSCERYATDAEMLAALRRFYDWESQQDAYPQRKSEVEVWRYIAAQLRPR